MDSVAVGSRSGVAMGWALPLQNPGHPEFRAENYFFPVTAKIGGASGYRTLECFVYVLWRLVHVGETFNGFAGFGL